MIVAASGIAVAVVDMGSCVVGGGGGGGGGGVAGANGVNVGGDDGVGVAAGIGRVVGVKYDDGDCVCFY